MPHKISRRDLLLSGSLFGLAALGGPSTRLVMPTRAQDMWKPERPVQVVIQFAAGGGTDTVVRTLLKEVEPILGQRIMITNMTGALGSIALEHVLQQPADGHTLVGTGNYNDYVRIAGIHDSISWMDWQFYQSNVSIASWSTHPDSQFETFADVIEYAKANPGQLRVSTDGEGGLWHEAISIVAQRAGFTFSNVPFDGGAPATLAGVQQEVDVAGGGLHEQVQFIRAGRLRNLATFTAEPVKVDDEITLEPITNYVPEVAGNAPFGGVYALGLRRDTPQEILETYAVVIEEAVKSPGFQNMLEERFMQEQFLTGEALDRRIARVETERAHLFQDLGLAKRTPEELGLPAPETFDEWWPPEGYTPAL